MSSRSFVARRQNAIVDLLKRRNSISISELSDTFGVSEITVRRDIKHLEDEGKVMRRYGSVRTAEHDKTDGYLSKRDTQRQIAKMAAQFVEEGDVIFINTSSTAIATLEFINVPDVTVITNNGSAINQPFDSSIDVYLTGGKIGNRRSSLTGDSTLSFVTLVKAKTCILGCDGISPEGGITTNEFKEMQVNRMMLENSSKSIIVATSEKIGKTAHFQFGSLDLVDMFITDTRATNAQINLLKFGGIKRMSLANANSKDDFTSLIS